MIEFKSEKKKIGSFKGSQIIQDGRSLIPRIEGNCIKSNECQYELWKEGPFVIFFIRPIYYIICSNCGDRLELEIDELSIIMKIIRLNNKLKDQLIDEDQYTLKMEKTMKTMYKKMYE